MSSHESIRTLLNKPFDIPHGVHELGRGIWLYLWLLANANAKGFVLREADTIADALEVTLEEAMQWLDRLVALKLIEVPGPPPHVVIKIPMWSAEPSRSFPSSGENTPQSPDALRGVPVSRLQAAKQQAASENIFENLAAASYGDRGLGEGVDLRELLVATLGAAEADEIGDALSDYPDAVVRKALDRVRTTPATQIRKSRLALFRYLLTKFSHEHAHARQ